MTPRIATLTKSPPTSDGLDAIPGLLRHPDDPRPPMTGYELLQGAVALTPPIQERYRVEATEVAWDPLEGTTAYYRLVYRDGTRDRLATRADETITRRSQLEALASRLIDEHNSAIGLNSRVA